MFNLYFEAMCEKNGLNCQKCVEHGEVALYIVQGITTLELIDEYDSICSGYVDVNDYFAADSFFSFLGEELSYDMEVQDLYDYFYDDYRKVVERDFEDIISLECVYGIHKWSLHKQKIFVIGEKDYVKLLEHLDQLIHDIEEDSSTVLKK